MKNRSKVIIAIILIIALLLNAFAYIGIINGSSTILSLLKRVNFSYIAPSNYFSIASRLQKKPKIENYKPKTMDDLISEKSYEFVRAAFEKDSKGVERILDPSANYIRSKDGSSFIRYIENGMHVEGYMATDKRLVETRQRWIIREKDHTATCCMEVTVEGSSASELWYLHFRNVGNDWKIYMMENNI